MPSVQIRPDVYWIGLNDRTTDLFEGIWPVTDAGVTYNSYLIRDRKNVIIDLAKGFKTDEYIEKIEAIVPLSEIDYIVVNHMEPDHTGAIRAFTRISPRLTILATEKAREMLAAFYGITENVRVVADGEELSLGRRTLKFVHAPFVHWPETMVTYDAADQILFSCDAFGGYGALPGTIFDDQCSDLVYYEREALRYFVNIVAKFSAPTLRAIEKLSGVPVSVIAPSHGLVWRRDPARIVELYRKWAELSTGGGETGVTLVYGSMYGNTEKMMNAVAQGISRAGIPVEIFDAARTHVSFILPSLWTQRGDHDRRAHLRRDPFPARGAGHRHGRPQAGRQQEGGHLWQLWLEQGRHGGIPEAGGTAEMAGHGHARIPRDSHGGAAETGRGVRRALRGCRQDPVALPRYSAELDA